MTRARSLLALVLCTVGAALAVSACPAQDICPCNLCGEAVELTVVEEDTQLPIDDFFVEVVRDGDPEGQPQSCDENFREENSCGFGNGPGVYVVIVQAPGYETLEASARIAAEEESEICCRACLSPKPLRVELTPLSTEEASAQSASQNG